ncbi:MAG TPA: hypothetical protein PK530_13140 [Anaerolineales bacterium]|nr:hypothetical protein [Anaerolineales bacterium]
MPSQQEVVCPNCSAYNFTSFGYCVRCGAALKDPQGAQSEPKKVNMGKSPLNRSSGTSYPALIRVAGLCAALSKVAIGISALVILGGLRAFFTEDYLFGISLIFAALFMGGLSYVGLNVIAEGIYVVIDLEHNTRRSAELLEKLSTSIKTGY